MGFKPFHELTVTQQAQVLEWFSKDLPQVDIETYWWKEMKTGEWLPISPDFDPRPKTRN